MTTIDVLSSPRTGGPLRWSKDLVRFLNQDAAFHAKLITSPPNIVAEHFLTHADVVHASVPMVIHPHGSKYVLTVKGDYTIEKAFWRVLYPHAIKNADCVTVPSQYLKDRTPALQNANVIPNAVDVMHFPQTVLREKDALTIVMVTNFWFEDKARGAIHVLDLLQTLLNPKKPFRFVVVGDGKYKDRVQQHQRQTRVPTDFVGWQDPREQLAHADVFVYYSYHDNMPNAVLEAMAAGLPVLTNNVGAIPEMIRDDYDGLIARDDDQFVSILHHIVQDCQLRRRLGMAARKRIEADFSWDKVVYRYFEIYKVLL